MSTDLLFGNPVDMERKSKALATLVCDFWMSDRTIGAVQKCPEFPHFFTAEDVVVVLCERTWKQNS